MAVEKEVRYTAIGVMSGSSLDGLDLALCTFVLGPSGWTYNIQEARTVAYTAEFQTRLLAVMGGTALDLVRLDRDLGDMIGEACADLLDGRTVDLIASHGHTIFHKPDEGLTVQIGHGARIAAKSGLPTITDFRTLDVAWGGQGAPLVPLGEELLFPAHKAFLNIGGICNIALHGKDSVIGYDVCIGNQALNALAQEIGSAFDRGGEMARKGTIDTGLLDRLNALPFHHQAPPRSLGREWFDAEVKPLITNTSVALNDRLRTIVEHIATMITRALAGASSSILTTGGGTHNSYLVERIRERSGLMIDVPDRLTVDYKEALVFGFLGIRRLRNESTAMASVTGASRDSSGGMIGLPY